MTPEELQIRWRSHLKSFSPTRWLRWRIDSKHAKWFGRTVEREISLFWGQPMGVLYPEHVSKKIAKKGYFERGLTEILLDKLKPGMTFYDIGAHYGYFSLLGSALVGPAGRVYSFEPTEATYKQLASNATRARNIITVNKAVYSRTTELVFCDRGSKDSSLNHVCTQDASGQEPQGIHVQAVSLDEFIAGHTPPDFVKVDAEGAEYEILQGMRGLIDQHQPIITLEVGEYINQQTGNPPSRQSVSFLLDRGYSAFEFSEGKIQPHLPIEEYSYDNLLFCHPDGVGGDYLHKN